MRQPLSQSRSALVMGKMQSQAGPAPSKRPKTQSPPAVSLHPSNVLHPHVPHSIDLLTFSALHHPHPTLRSAEVFSLPQHQPCDLILNAMDFARIHR